MSERWAFGDVQGYLSRFQGVLRSVGLIGERDEWTGGDSRLVVVGDLVDRGPDGVGVIDVLMRLSDRVDVVIGNHDVLLLAAHRFGDAVIPNWLAAGGCMSDLEALTDEHVAWLSGLPAMLLREDTLFVHADALFYLRYGSTLQAVNSAFADVLRADERGPWDRLLEEFAEHRAFSGANGEANLNRFLGTFGGQRLVHGHTPIARMLECPPESVTEAHVYCGGRCVNVDPGMYLGGPGFMYRL